MTAPRDPMTEMELTQYDFNRLFALIEKAQSCVAGGTKRELDEALGELREAQALRQEMSCKWRSERLAASHSTPAPVDVEAGEQVKRYEWVRSGMACVNAKVKAIPWCEREYFVLASDYDLLTKQLPPEMQRCTIRFVECAQGHGRLTATNWIDHGCTHCAIDALKAERDSLREQVAALSANDGRLREALTKTLPFLRGIMREALSERFARDLDIVIDLADAALSLPAQATAGGGK